MNEQRPSDPSTDQTDQPFLPDAATEERLHAADHFAYGSMFDAAGGRVGSGRAFVGGAMAMWNPRDESCAYNCLIAFECAADPDRTWQEGRAAALAGGARVFGVGVTPARADWATPETLTELGLVWEYEELVWARWLDERDGPLPSPTQPPGVVLRSDPADLAAARELYGRVLNRGWGEPEEHGRGHLYAAAIGLPGWTHYLAEVDGAPAGAGALCLHDGVALCMVAATDPAFRGRGVQSALIGRRLSEAVAAGCDVAVSETVDDNASPRNFRRAGFRLVTRRQMYRTEL
jgi:ribosomal protein S18 acetylase RimI-like enzyme